MERRAGTSTAPLTKSLDVKKHSANTAKTNKKQPKEIPATTVKRKIHPVIEIVNGSKHFGFYRHWRHVLTKFNMTVYEGEVYALLGPHGCGKSTVLNIVLGFQNLDVGQVTIFGFRPGNKLSGIPGIRVGYTPQSSGLYPEFTINETLRYFGLLLGLNRQYISQRMAFLSNLLKIPHDEQYIKTCTEGTKRQISFAVALLHEPEVLILDEPCSGIDPVLRRSLLEHMRQLAKEDKTILITTQSCEEARMADKIGFMRNGRLLVDGNPRELLTLYQEKLLESLYRRVYNLDDAQPRKRSSSSLEENPIVKLEPLNVSSEGFIYSGEEPPSRESVVKAKYKLSAPTTRRISLIEICSGNCSFRRLAVLIVRDATRSLRKYLWLFLFLLVPSLLVMVFCITIGTTPSSLVLAVVNHEASEEDCLVNYDNFLSCQVLSLLNTKIIKQREFHLSNDAMKAAHNLEVAAVLIIKKTFSAYINKALANVILGKDDYSVEIAPMTLHLDMTSKIIANTIENEIKGAISKYLLEATKDTPTQGAGLGYPLTIGPPIYGSQRTTDTEYMAPGLIVMFIYHMAAFVAAITLVTDRVNKLAQRNYLAGVHLRETVLSQMIVYGLIVMVQAVLLFCVLLVVFDMPNYGSLLYAALITIVQIWCGISLGVLTAMICKTSVGAGLFVFCSIVFTLFLCGIQWPLSGLPRWLYLCIQVLPQTKSIEALRTIFQRGTDITYNSVWYGIVIPVGWMWLFTLSYSLIHKLI